MPPRSNDFQAIVYLIKRTLAGDAVVTESAMLPDSVTGTPREVDITIEAEVAGHTVLIGPECRDHAKRQSVTWVEEMHAKHSYLPTNRLILISSSGFSKEAHKKAAVHGIELIAPGDLTEDFVGSLVNRASSIGYRQTEVDLEQVTVTLAINDHSPARPHQVDPETLIFFGDGAKAGVMRDVAISLLKLSRRTGTMPPQEPGERAEFKLSLDPLLATRKGRDSPEPVHLKPRKSPDTMIEVKSVTVTGAIRVNRTDVSLRHGDFSGTPYSTGKASIGEGEMLMVVTEAEGGKGKLALRYS